MTLADKILSLRRQHGWSQEELAARLAVSRQSVSKWESGQSLPDIDKILELSRLFGVSTDYLLKEEVSPAAEIPAMEAEPIAADSAFPTVPEAEAAEFLAYQKWFGKRVACGVMLCILSPVTLILLGGCADVFRFFPLSEGACAAIGIGVLFLLVAAAVALFITAVMRGDRFRHIINGNFTPAPETLRMAAARRFGEQGRFTNHLVIGVVLCIFAVLPLILGGCFGAGDFALIVLLSLMFVLVSIAVYLFIDGSTVRMGCDMLLSEGDYTPEKRRAERAGDRIGGIYWPIIVMIYLAWSFASGDWHFTWVIWPAAGLLFAALSNWVGNR